ncbi:MAG: CRTAC1 family protein [Pseudorhodobacter sp.]|nr:CRTAC1 family protein [Pseudorhodobacter sp.]
MKTVLILSVLPGVALADPAFIDRSAALPVAQVYDGEWEHFVGGGVAILDCNGDHLPDLYAAGGTNPAQLFVNTTAVPGADITFAEGRSPELTGVTGAWPIDIDGDGWLDLAVLRVGPNVLLKGGPDCQFSDATAAWGFAAGDRWSTAFTATWQAGQDWPVLVVGNYVDRTRKDGPFGACDVNELHRPYGLRYAAPILLDPGYCALSMLISDWQRNGVPDLRISNDRHYYVRSGYEQMYHLNPLAEYTEAEGWKRLSLWGMGIASRDITGDGLPEVMLTSMADQVMQINDGSGKLHDAPYGIGTYAQHPFIGDDGRPSTGWHAEFGDIDNDGRADLFIAKGNVQEMPSNAMADPNNLLMQKADGTFAEKADVAGVASVTRSRGAGLADMNGDGRLDIVVMNRRAPMELWQNATPGTGNWLEVEPMQAGGNRRAVGAWVEVRVGDAVQAQEITVGGGHGSGQALALHFGLGDADKAEVRVIWPGGAVSDWASVAVNRRVMLVAEGAGLLSK